MCLIILVNDKKSFNKNDLKTAYKRNQNGMGVMYVNKNNEFVSDKFLPKNENEVINFYNLHSSKTNKIAIHLRFTTEGKTNKKNCHPFISYKKDNHFIGLMHNGPKLPIPIHNSNFSDTWHYNEYLKNLFQHNPKLIFNKDFQRELEAHIGTEKLIFLDSKSKQFIIINEFEGNYQGSNWYSNEYWQDMPKISYLSDNDNQLNFYGNEDNFNGWNYLDDDKKEVLKPYLYDYDKEKPKRYLNNHLLDEFYSDDRIKNTPIAELYDFVDDCYYSEDMTPIYDLVNRYKGKIQKK